MPNAVILLKDDKYKVYYYCSVESFSGSLQALMVFVILLRYNLFWEPITLKMHLNEKYSLIDWQEVYGVLPFLVHVYDCMDHGLAPVIVIFPAW